MFGFELLSPAELVGMKAFMDLDHGRTLIFCNDTCADAERKKNGTFRLRPRGPAKSVQAAEGA